MAQQPITTAIMKDTNMTVVKPGYRFGVLFDGSAIAVKVLQKTLSMMDAVKDKLTTITVVEPGMDHEAIVPKVRAHCGPDF